MDEHERRTRRLRRLRALIRIELTLAFAVPFLAAFLFVAMPGGPSPMVLGERPLVETLVPWAGVGLYMVGLVWMIRLSRPDPEAGERSWRYREYD